MHYVVCVCTYNYVCVCVYMYVCVCVQVGTCKEYEWFEQLLEQVCSYAHAYYFMCTYVCMQMLMINVCRF